MPALLARLIDYRQGEGRLAAQAFGILFMVVAGHTMLETARDALFLSKLPPSQLNIVYIGLAALSFVLAAATSAFTRPFGQRNTLMCALVLAAYATVLVHHFPVTPRAVFALYFLSGSIGAVLAPQFWTLAAQLFTVAQGRRLFGPIASGGVLGGVAGASLAALLLSFVDVTTLLPVAALLFVGSAILVTTITVDGTGAGLLAGPRDARAQAEREVSADAAPAVTAFRRSPLLFRLAALVAVSTAALLILDYLFKSTAARVIPPAELGAFFARYYAWINGASLLVQLALAGRLVRRLGVVGAVQVTPFLLLGGGLAGVVTGGAMLAVLAMKGIDGSLRHSLNRVAMELLYLPVPAERRNRAKSFIDTVLVRVVQAGTSGVLFGLSVYGLATPRTLAIVIAALSGIWLMLASSLAMPYLNLFREALTAGTLDGASTGSLDLFAAGALIEGLSSSDAVQVIAAVDLLAAKGHQRLVPALMLRHDAPSVVTHVLGLFGDSRRADWIPLAVELLDHKDETIRMAALRALAKHDVVSAIERATNDPNSAIHTYAVFQLAIREVTADLFEHPLVADIMSVPGEWGDSLRRGLLAAITDSPDARSSNVLLELTRRTDLRDGLDRAGTGMNAAVARAMGQIKDPRFIPACIQMLAAREGREAVHEALAAMGEPAFVVVREAMTAADTPRRIALQLPMTAARFGTQDACDLLSERLLSEPIGHIRFRVLRALGQLVVAHPALVVDRLRVESLATNNLRSHLLSVALTVALQSKATPGLHAPATENESASARLLLELLQDKGAQALDRAFRMLKIAHPSEDIQRVFRAVQSRDQRARANAVEFVSTLLSRRDQGDLRALFLVVVDDVAPEERVTRARAWLPEAPRNASGALALLLQDADESLAAVAAHHALSLGDNALRRQVASVLAERPSLASVSSRLFGMSAVSLEVASG